MPLRVVGAGLPRTGTRSLHDALAVLLGGRCYHISEIPGHPFDLGVGWQPALAGVPIDWVQQFAGYVAAVDWPASFFWREVSAAYPDALVLLSVRESAALWWQSMNATVLPVARRACAPDWSEGRDLLTLLERFTHSEHWDDPALLQAAYEQHNAAVRASVPHDRLLERQASEGWAPLCHVLRRQRQVSNRTGALGGVGLEESSGQDG